MNTPSSVLIRLSSAVLTKSGVYQKLADAIRQLTVARHRVIVVVGADKRLLDFARNELVERGIANKLPHTALNSVRSLATELLVCSLKKAGVQANIHRLDGDDSMECLVEQCNTNWGEQQYPSRPQVVVPLRNANINLDEMSMDLGGRLGVAELLLLAPTPGVMTIDPYVHHSITPRTCNRTIRQLPLYVLSKLHSVEPSFPKPAVVQESLSKGISVRICNVQGINKACDGTVLCSSHDMQLETPIFTSGRTSERRLFLSAADTSSTLLESLRYIRPSPHVREYSIAWESGKLTVSIAASEANDLGLIYPVIHADESIVFWRHESKQRAAVIYFPGTDCGMSLVGQLISSLAKAQVNLLSLSTTAESVSLTVTPEHLLVAGSEIETAFGNQRTPNRARISSTGQLRVAKFGTFRESIIKDQPGQIWARMSECEGSIFWIRETSFNNEECRIEIAYQGTSECNGVCLTLPITTIEQLISIIRTLNEVSGGASGVERWQVSVNREQVEIVVRCPGGLGDIVRRLGLAAGGEFAH